MADRRRDDSNDYDSYSDNDYQDSFSRGSKGGRFERPRPGVDLKFDYKDIPTLKRYLSEHAHIVPARITRLNATQQRSLTTAIKRARQLALLPVASHHRESDF